MSSVSHHTQHTACTGRHADGGEAPPVPLMLPVRQPADGEEPLLPRDEFRERVFARDGHRCVNCGAPAQDAHHIMERRLFPDGGYYMSNGASVCGACHLAAEATDLHPDVLRYRAGIEVTFLPDHLYADELYDKWGNIYLPDGTRLPGELFWDPSVQKVISSHRGEFRLWVKYPRTHHLPWSPGASEAEDDRVMATVATPAGDILPGFYACPPGESFATAAPAEITPLEVVVTEKMDGENTTMYSDHIHARSPVGRSHPSQDWVKNLWSKIRYEIPYGWRICGENLFARHSIAYDDLPSFFMVFSIWDEKNRALSWDETVEWAELLGLETVPVLYRGPFDPELIRRLWSPPLSERAEGYVVRTAAGFPLSEFPVRVGKFVRSGFVAGRPHWFYGQRPEPNRLRAAG